MSIRRRGSGPGPGTRTVLGINSFSHDTSACLLVEGHPVAIAEQERFDRRTHTKAFPDDAIGYCLDSAGMSMADVDLVCFAHKAGTDLLRGGIDALSRLSARRLGAQAFTDGRLVARRASFERSWGYRGPIMHVGHHESHAASAFYSSGFDSSAVLTLDRGGDFLSTTLAVGEGTRLTTIQTIKNPHSLGEAYSALTWYLGFVPGADEGKVMGLAPFGRPGRYPQLASLLVDKSDGTFEVDLSWFAYQREGRVPVSAKFLSTYGPRRVPESEISRDHEDIAFGLQEVVERAGVHLAEELGRRSGSKHLSMAGGVALNSVMNARVVEEAGYDRVFIQPASSDAGNALGAALFAWHHHLGNPRSFTMDHAFFGPEPSEKDHAAALGAAGLAYEKVPDPESAAAELIAAGKVVGWFRGRAEIGPRALGNRSILADPRREEMRDVVNARVKRREGFRPFAPSVLDHRGPEYFTNYSTNPFMLLVLPVREAKRSEIPAVTHVDGSGRLQSVTEAFNPSFHRLISRFEALTGVPVVLNTSFNLRGEPMVSKPEEAVADYLRSEMDALFLGPLLVSKPGAAGRTA
ncbi:MAG: carbamoyltransferase family protein [Acidimicrobiales bacterium]